MYSISKFHTFLSCQQEVGCGMDWPKLDCVHYPMLKKFNFKCI